MWYDTCQKHLGEYNSTLLWEVNLRSDTSDAETCGRDKGSIMIYCVYVAGTWINQMGALKNGNSSLTDLNDWKKKKQTLALNAF